MNEPRKLAVIGGDERQIRLVSRLSERMECSVFGLPGAIGNAVRCDDFCDALRDADALLLPLPATRDGETVNAPLSMLPPPKLTEIGEAFSGRILLGGRLPEAVRALLEARGIAVRNLAEDDAFLTRNAVPTAEGALEILLGALDVTVSGSAMLVTGYGRVGQATARLLAACGARVTVAARSEVARALAAAVGCDTVDLRRPDLAEALAHRHFTAVVNTVPAPIFDEAALGAFAAGTPIVELASSPCLDAAVAARRGLTYLPALSLPGRTAPETAAKILEETVLARLTEVFI